MMRGVYEEGKQFSIGKELESTLIEAWEQIGQKLLELLVCLMPNMCISVIKRSGQKITYWVRHLFYFPSRFGCCANKTGKNESLFRF